MPLAHGLQVALAMLVDDLIAGIISQSDGDKYGLVPYRDSLMMNGKDDADEVLNFLNVRTQRLTDRTQVIYADRKYFETPAELGLTFAYVQLGEDDSSPNAWYFGIAGNGAYYSERASDEKIAEVELDLATRLRMHAKREAGRAAAAKFLQLMRQHVSDAVNELSSSLTYEQRQDINRVVGVFPAAKPLTDFFQVVWVLDLEKLCTILAIVGKTKLPSY